MKLAHRAAIEYAACPSRMLLDLAEMAANNGRLRRMWLANFHRITDEIKRK